MSVSLAGIPMEDLYAEHGTAITQYVACRTYDKDLVDDLVHDAFLRAIVYADQYTGDVDGIRSWLTGQASCAVGNYKWSQRRYRRAAFTVLRAAEPEPVDVTATLPIGLAEALARLPELLRRTVQLRVLDGLSLNGVAAEMGCTQNTVVVRQRRAFELLREAAGVRS